MIPFLLQEDTSSPGQIIGGIIVLGIVAFIYFLPAYVGRKKKNADSIALLNLFLGWTLVGWVVALVWASSTDAPERVVVVQQPTPPPPAAMPSASVADELEKLVRLRDSGALTESEFAQQKARVLGSEPAPPATPAVPVSIQMAQLRHRHHRGEISADELTRQLEKLGSKD